MKAAYLNVWSKKGIAEMAYGLKAAGLELYASGSTAKTLAQAELEINPGLERPPSPAQVVSALELDPENPADARKLAELDFPRPDIVVCNLHPISEIISQESFALHELARYVDIWNSALLRAAARSWESAGVVCDFSDYATVLSAIKEFGELHEKRRRQLAVKALLYCAYYDSTVAQFLAERRQDVLSDELVLPLKKVSALSYGENPQQNAALYSVAGARPWGVTRSRIIHGKPLRFNHYVDLDQAWETACEFDGAACVIVKHGTPCGAACAQNSAEAFREAYETDRTGSQGATVVFNRQLTDKAAALLADESFELIAAPDFENGALEVLRSRRENRLVLIPSTLVSADEVELRSISGGVLVQENDSGRGGQTPAAATRRKPTQDEAASLGFAMKVAKHARSYAMVVAQGLRTISIGSGLPSRRESLKAALQKAKEKHPIVEPARPLVLACDAALTPDCVKDAARAGISAISQPGGSAEDKDCAALCDARNMAMLLTGLRHIRH